HVPRFERISLHVHDMISINEVCFRWHKLDKEFKFFRCTHDRFHFDPVTEKHDKDQGGQLPEEVHSLKPKYDSHTVHISNCNCYCNQSHHSKRFGFYLCNEA